MNTEIVLEVQDLKKTYQLGSVPVHALRGVSFQVNAGDFVSILGPSGSGKSTLLNMIGALDRPSDGDLSIRGTGISTLNDNELAELRQRVGFVFQFFNLISRLDATGNVELPLTIAGVPSQERRARAEKMLEKVGLGDRMHHKPSELSGGERQRVAVARALVSDPSFLLMDEPTGNLDSVTAAEIMDLVETVNHEFGMTIIVVTHDPEVSDRAHRKIRLVDGCIASDEVNHK
ncbi:MAG: ABC transporter ATP-binding protein [Candidatus Thorarchaeota archaeon]